MLGAGGIFEGEFTILDLEPDETSLEIEVESKGDALTAQKILFWPTVDVAKNETRSGDSKPPTSDQHDQDDDGRS